MDLVDKMQCSSTDSEFLTHTAHGLTRALLSSLIKSLKEEADRDHLQINLTNSYYRNIVHMTV
jgi:hypothetical protein